MDTRNSATLLAPRPCCQGPSSSVPFSARERKRPGITPGLYGCFAADVGPARRESGPSSPGLSAPPAGAVRIDQAGMLAHAVRVIREGWPGMARPGSGVAPPWAGSQRLARELSAGHGEAHAARSPSRLVAMAVAVAGRWGRRPVAVAGRRQCPWWCRKMRQPREDA